jgi:sugar phosphate isomerase/epimerase
MLRALNAGAIHVSIKNLTEGIEACKIGGFDCLAMSPGLIAENSVEEVNELLFEAIIAPGAWGIPFNWRGTQEEYDAGLEAMKGQVQKMHDVHVSRCATWIMPGSNELTMEANTDFHRTRLTPIAHLLEDFGMILGLEFVGPKTTRNSFSHPFFYDLNGMYSFAETIAPNVGLLVDAWHMHTSGSSNEDLEKIAASKIALVHINDAPTGVPNDELKDHIRCLPCETGVIDMSGFMSSLRKIGYTGPVEAEPFDATLKDLASDIDRLEKTGRAVANAFRA